MDETCGLDLGGVVEVVQGDNRKQSNICIHRSDREDKVATQRSYESPLDFVSVRVGQVRTQVEGRAGIVGTSEGGFRREGAAETV